MFREEAEELCHKWAPFLINHFPKEGGFDWEETDFYKWMIDAHPVCLPSATLLLFLNVNKV
jgi:hypothetical protein